MSKKTSKKKQKEKKCSAEKPVGLWGPSFHEVVGALVKAKPMPKETSKD
jgi:hypothetical protein